jgi:GNAT superfamily N-acetyltransferase
MITYSDNVGGLRAEQLTGFFVGWPVAPSATTLLRVLQASYRSMVAIDDDTGQVVGVINALSDGLLAGFIPLLEVLPSHQRQGIGSEVVRRMLAALEHLYAVDLVCDPSSGAGMSGSACGHYKAWASADQMFSSGKYSDASGSRTSGISRDLASCSRSAQERVTFEDQDGNGLKRFRLIHVPAADQQGGGDRGGAERERDRGGGQELAGIAAAGERVQGPTRWLGSQSARMPSDSTRPSSSRTRLGD